MVALMAMVIVPNAREMELGGYKFGTAAAQKLYKN